MFLHIYKPLMFELTTVRDDRTMKITIESCLHKNMHCMKINKKHIILDYSILCEKSQQEGCHYVLGSCKKSPPHHHKYTECSSAHMSTRKGTIYFLYRKVAPFFVRKKLVVRLWLSLYIKSSLATRYGQRNWIIQPLGESSSYLCP